MSQLGLALAVREKRRRTRLRAWQDDPVAMAHDAGFPDLDPFQQQVLQSDAQTVLLRCGRQCGKSVISAILAVHQLLFDDSLVLVVSPSLRQSAELFRYILRAWRTLKKPVPYESVNKHSLELRNSSRCIALPGSSETIRGLSRVRLLLVDEAACVPAELYQAVAPMLSVSNGRMVALSTPAGRQGWWFGLHEVDDPTILKIGVSSYQCPRISRSFLDRERSRISDYWADQEYGFADGRPPAFHDSQTQAFPSWAINQALSDEIAFDQDLFRL